MTSDASEPMASHATSACMVAVQSMAIALKTSARIRLTIWATERLAGRAAKKPKYESHNVATAQGLALAAQPGHASRRLMARLVRIVITVIQRKIPPNSNL